MKSGTIQKYLPVLLLAIILLLVWRWNGNRDKDKPARRSEDIRLPSGAVNDVPGFDRTAHLEYTVHARCRMDCRHVTETEVEEILAKGSIDLSKSNLHDKPCPTYALEGYSHEGQHLRIIFATCREATRVVTCIDLDKKWKCNCD